MKVDRKLQTKKLQSFRKWKNNFLHLNTANTTITTGVGEGFLLHYWNYIDLIVVLISSSLSPASFTICLVSHKDVSLVDTRYQQPFYFDNIDNFFLPPIFGLAISWQIFQQTSWKTKTLLTNNKTWIWIFRYVIISRQILHLWIFIRFSNSANLHLQKWEH